MLRFIRSKNLLHSTTDIKRIVLACKICAHVKPLFVQRDQGILIKAMCPIEWISIDFKGPLPLSTFNKYLFSVINKYSYFLFVFLGNNMTTVTVIKCLDQLFSLGGTDSFVLSNNANSFSCLEFKGYLEQCGISSNKCSIYHYSENRQAENRFKQSGKESN